MCQVGKSGHKLTTVENAHYEFMIPHLLSQVGDDEAEEVGHGEGLGRRERPGLPRRHEQDAATEMQQFSKNFQII